MDTHFVLRRANISDIDALSQLSRRTSQETFVEDLCIPYPEKDFEAYLCSSASPEWFTNKINDPKGNVWVIQDKANGELIAYAVASPCDTDDIPHPDMCSNKDGALNRLYVRRDQQSHRFGRQLMDVTLSWFKEHFPARPIWLSVLSENVRAQRFYSHYDFHKVGDYYYPVGEWKDLEFVMKRQPDTV